LLSRPHGSSAAGCRQPGFESSRSRNCSSSFLRVPATGCVQPLGFVYPRESRSASHHLAVFRGPEGPENPASGLKEQPRHRRLAATGDLPVVLPVLPAARGRMERRITTTNRSTDCVCRDARQKTARRLTSRHPTARSRHGKPRFRVRNGRSPTESKPPAREQPRTQNTTFPQGESVPALPPELPASLGNGPASGNRLPPKWWPVPFRRPATSAGNRLLRPRRPVQHPSTTDLLPGPRCHRSGTAFPSAGLLRQQETVQPDCRSVRHPSTTGLLPGPRCHRSGTAFPSAGLLRQQETIHSDGAGSSALPRQRACFRGLAPTEVEAASLPPVCCVSRRSGFRLHPNFQSPAVTGLCYWGSLLTEVNRVSLRRRSATGTGHLPSGCNHDVQNPSAAGFCCRGRRATEVVWLSLRRHSTAGAGFLLSQR
jgi:hypothetical protein